MESLGLREFLDTTGRAVHSLNTICVGLHGVEQGRYEKPEDLTITWEPRDVVASSRTARQFAIESSLVFVVEALLQYLKYVGKHPVASRGIRDAVKTAGAAKKVEELTQLVTPGERYWTPVVILLIHWRNRIVHFSSKAKLSTPQARLLQEDAETIKKRHANIDINQTLQNFKEGKITLKDASTLIAITIRFVRAIDEAIQLDANTIESVQYWIHYLKLAEEYKKQLHSNGKSTQKRKLVQFFKTHLPFMAEEIVDRLSENPLVLTDSPTSLDTEEEDQDL